MEIKLVQLGSFAIGGLLVALLVNVVLLRFSQTLGIRNKNDVIIRWSNESKPSLGGVSFFVVFFFSVIAYAITFREGPSVFQNKSFVGLIGGGSIAFLMGLADDAYNTKPLLKLAVQILCGLILVVTGTSIDLFHIPALDGVLTMLWVVIIMNSLNMLDNMDGITGTTVFFIILSSLLSNWILFGFNANSWSIITISVLGALIGFLSMNIHPSKLFMGDAGSQFIGFFASFVAIDNLWNAPAHAESPSYLGFFIVLVAFTPAAVDTLTVVINRVKAGKSPMVGGKDHTTHHLVYAGLNDRQVWYVFLLVSILSGLLVIAMINLLRLGAYIPIPFFALYTAFVFFLLYRNTIKYKAPQK